ncbi:MAG: phospholipase [Sylvanvirus sp.]|uniref:Phospholipase n=1 Tax=Sylvanvirus sp. TaxID=2487774 RepID=A0A3G5AIW9_9VIRU|nr:MAG: phospholipase [Sylvanvirus sp.]
MEKIEHIVVLMLENKTFHNVFADFEGVAGSMRSKKARKEWINKDSLGNLYYPKKIKDPTFRFSKYLDNNAIVTMHQMENHNTGFVRVLDEAFRENHILPQQENKIELKTNKPTEKIKSKYLPQHDAHVGSTAVGQPLYYFAKGTLKCTHTLAAHYVICDHYYASAASATWSNRLIALSGTSKGIYETPMNITEVPFDRMLKQNQTTIFDLMLEKKVSFKVYYGDFPLSLLLESNWKPSILEHHRPMLEFYEACKVGKESEFPNFAWIEPTYGNDGNSNHPPENPENAEVLIGEIYNALRKNEALWNKTMFIVTSDEGGGLADELEPPLAWEHRESLHTYKRNRILSNLNQRNQCCIEQIPDVHACLQTWTEKLADFSHSACIDVCGFDVNQVYNRAPPKYCRHIFGLRVPTFIMSPWLMPKIESCTYDHTSILHTICKRWKLDPTRLGPRVPLATTFWHLFEDKDTDQPCLDLDTKKLEHIHAGFWYQYMPSWFPSTWCPWHSYKLHPPKCDNILLSSDEKQNQDEHKRTSKSERGPLNKFGLLEIPKHDRTCYSGQPANWSHFQMDMFRSVCWVAQGLGRLPETLKHPLLMLENSWSTATGWLKNVW